MQGLDRLLTAQELADYLNVPLSYIRHRCHQKTIPFFKIGNHIRFRMSDVERWLNASAVRPDRRVENVLSDVLAERR